MTRLDEINEAARERLASPAAHLLDTMRETAVAFAREYLRSAAPNPDVANLARQFLRAVGRQ